MSRRIEKLTRTIRDVISDSIQNHLSDPRIKGLVSVTRVELAPDLSVAKIFISVVGVEEKQQQLSFEAVKNASGFMRSHLAKILTTRICPALVFHLDNSLKKGFEVCQILNRLADERLDSEIESSNVADVDTEIDTKDTTGE